MPLPGECLRAHQFLHSPSSPKRSLPGQQPASPALARLLVPRLLRTARPLLCMRAWRHQQLPHLFKTFPRWQGLEPALALVSLAGKRLSPGDPDKTVARPPPIPWWDDLR